MSKGDTDRTADRKAYEANFENIFRKLQKPVKKMTINPKAPKIKTKE